MRITKLIKTGLVLTVFMAIIFSWNRGFTSGSGSGGGYSNASGEGNCATCHTGTSLTSNASNVVLTMNGSTTLKYKTDSTYNMELTVTQSGISKFGFLITVLKDSSNTGIGSWGTSTSDVQKSTGNISGKSRGWVFHTSSGTSGSGSRTWKFTWTAPHTNAGTITFYAIANAANGNSLETGDQIFANKFTATYIPPVTPDPGFTFSPSNPCDGDTVTIKDTTTRNPTSWKWTFSGGTPSSSTVQNPKVAFKFGTQTITLVATNKFGAGPSYSKNITVTQNPGDTVYRGGPTTFCDGQSVLLIGDFSASDFKWSNGETNQSIYAKKAGTYYVTASNGKCSKKSQVVTINTLPKPPITLLRTINNDTICSGDTSRFVVNTNASVKTVKYFVNGKLVSGNTGLSLAIPGLTGNNNKIFAVAIDTLGCVSDSSKIFKVVVRAHLLAPVLTAGTSTTNSVTAKWTAVAGAKGYQVSEDSGKTWKSPLGTLTHTLSGMNFNAYISLQVRAIDVAPCNMGTVGSIQLNSLPCSQTTYKVKADSFICKNGSVSVSINRISAPHYGVILNGTPKKDTLYNFSPTADTIIHFDMIDSVKANCGTFGFDIPVKVIVVPTSFHISADKTGYCGNTEPAIINATGKFDEYDFYMHDSLVQRDTARVYVTNYFNDGERIVLTGKVHGCPSDSSQPLILHKYLQPVAGFKSTLGYDREVTFSNTSVYQAKTIWYFGDSTTDTTTNPVHTYGLNKTYEVSVVVIGEGGCKDSISNGVIVTTNTKPVGIAPSVNPETLVIKPNPFNNDIMITFYGNNAGILHLNIIDNQGRIVKETGITRLIKGNNEINVSTDALKPGTYFLKMDDGQQVLRRQLLKY